MTCTTMDHVYPDGPNGGRPLNGAACLCGRRRWNQDADSYAGPAPAATPKRARAYPPRKGSLVELRHVPGVRYAVAEVDREAGMFKVSAAGDVGGWLDEHDLA